MAKRMNFYQARFYMTSETLYTISLILTAETELLRLTAPYTSQLYCQAAPGAQGLVAHVAQALATRLDH
jgi:hypothetical protein